MLRELKVRDLALVAQATVRFEPGLNLLTGETGSGKSLIIDALGLALGARAEAEQVRHGAERALVDAIFENDGTTLVLQREVGKRGSARVDGRVSNPSRLRDLARSLVGMHGQHEHHALLDSQTQTELLDGYAGAGDLRAAVAEAHAAWTVAVAAVDDLERMRSAGQREKEFLRWQLDELRSVNPVAGEDDELTAERRMVRHATRLAELGQEAMVELSDDGLGRAAAAARFAAELDPRLAELSTRLEAIVVEAADVSAELRRYGEQLDSDPRRLEAIESRLSVLEGIKRKYGGSLQSAIADRKRLETQLGATEDLEGAIKAAKAKRERHRAAMTDAAASLTRARTVAAARLAKAVVAEVAGLRLEGARFEIALRDKAEVGPDGAETAEMLFSANPGEPVAPLTRVASGGELARLMLAIKTAGADADRMPTLVFDEVDAGIGGEAAIQVGLRLKALGARHQILVVTHLAQIACFADHHLVVEKKHGRDGRSVVGVRELKSDEEKAHELARMMSGGVTAKALARARELLDDSR